jgi:benzodiazapine receptor
MTKIIPITIIKLLASLLVCQLAGFVGSLFTAPNIATWYDMIHKPAFTPPDAVFAPVWITLYILMGIAAFLVWNKGIRTEGVDIAISVFVIQLILNMLWSIAFFGMHSPLAGLIVIGALWVAILLTIVSFFKISMAAGILLIPYILWVGFAAVLNYSIVILNHQG